MNALCLVVALTFSAGDEPTLLAFTAPNCAACEASKPAVARLIDAGAPIQYIDYVEQPQLCKQFRVTSFPTFVLVANGKEVDRIVGQADFRQLAKLLIKAAPSADASVAKEVANGRRGEVVRGQSPDEAPRGLFGGALGRLMGSSGGPARRAEATERRDPFVKGRGTSARSDSSDSEIEIAHVPSGAAEGAPKRTPATPVGRSTPQRTVEPTSDEGAADEDEITIGHNESGRSVGVEGKDAAPRDASPRMASQPPSNRLRGSVAKNVRAAADNGADRPSRASHASEGSLSPQQRAIASTVRVKVIDSRGASDGSGVVIHTREDEALIATCGHIFRESQGRGRIMIDLFIPGAAPVEGALLEYNIDRDIALISMRPGVEVVATPVAPAGYQFAQGDEVFSVGCQRGREPELIESSITGINRYKAPPHIVIQGAPAQGRSGGGLFSEEGYLIGICNAADKQGREGIFAGLPTIHGILDNRNLSVVYRHASPLKHDQDFAMAGHTETSQEDAIPEMELGMPDVDPTTLEESDDQGSVTAEYNEPEMIDRQDRRAEATPRGARLGESIVEADEGEADIICIVRSRTNPTGQNDVLVIREATPELLAQISRAAAPPPDASRPGGFENESAAKIVKRPDQANRRTRPGVSAPSSARPRGPIVRGQSMR